MSLLNILFGLLLICAGICGQKIEFQVPQKSTSCEKGFRANLDPYNITATIGPRFIELHPLGWILLLKVQVATSGTTDYQTFCEVAISPNGTSCDPQSTNPCYCNQYDNSTSTAHILVKYLARASHSLGTVRGLLDNTNGSFFYSSTINTNLPEIYDVKDAVLTLTVNGAPADTTPGSCGLSFKANEVNTVKLCCSKVVIPCYPRLAFNGIDVAKGISPCVEYKFTANETVNVTKFYSVCDSTEYTSGFCLIQTSNAPPDNTPGNGTDNVTVAANSSSSAVNGTDNTSTKPTSSSSTVTGTDNTSTKPTSSSSTVTGASDKDSNLGLALGLGLCLGISALIGGIALGIYFWKKKLYCFKNPGTGHNSAKVPGASKSSAENIDMDKTDKGDTPSDGNKNTDQDETYNNAGLIGDEDNQATQRTPFNHRPLPNINRTQPNINRPLPDVNRPLPTPRENK